jgi:hypothetical protein
MKRVIVTTDDQGRIGLQVEQMSPTEALLMLQQAAAALLPAAIQSEVAKAMQEGGPRIVIPRDGKL